MYFRYRTMLIGHSLLLAVKLIHKEGMHRERWSKRFSLSLKYNELLPLWTTQQPLLTTAWLLVPVS